MADPSNQVVQNISAKSGTSTIQSDVMRRAEKIQADLAHEFPSMIMSMKPSYVTRGFLLTLNKKFCQKHMPKEDTMFVLEDESKQSLEAKYIARSKAMSAGWVRFAKKHELKEGDVVVFHLVSPTRFKVYIVRISPEEFQKLEANSSQMNPSKSFHTSVHTHPLLSKKIYDTNFGPVSNRSDEIERGEDLGFELTDEIRLPKFDRIDFEQVKSWKDFDIIVDGSVLNPELSKSLQYKYYELCSSQKSFLHDHLLEGLNSKLVAGVIAETIKIADGIRASRLATCQNDFPTWERTLRSFQGLGMNVGFLSARLDQLMTLSARSKRNEKAEPERSSGEELKLSETKETASGQDAEIGTSKVDTENLENIFQEIAKAPWLRHVEQGDGAN